MGGGNPSTWPAARAKAPSLAGAYSANLKTAFLALVRYSDWLGTHPNPKLVKNYVLPTSNIYRAQEYLMRQMVVRGWHISPAPTEINFIKVVTPPVTRTLPDKDKYMGGVIECVINEMKYPYLRPLPERLSDTPPERWTDGLWRNLGPGQTPHTILH